MLEQVPDPFIGNCQSTHRLWTLLLAGLPMLLQQQLPDFGTVDDVSHLVERNIAIAHHR
jgi:hypothetical protein